MIFYVRVFQNAMFERFHLPASGWNQRQRIQKWPYLQDNRFHKIKHLSLLSGIFSGHFAVYEHQNTRIFRQIQAKSHLIDAVLYTQAGVGFGFKKITLAKVGNLR